MYCPKCHSVMEANDQVEVRTVESQHCPRCNHMVEIREASGGFFFRYDCEERPSSPTPSR